MARFKVRRRPVNSVFLAISERVTRIASPSQNLLSVAMFRIADSLLMPWLPNTIPASLEKMPLNGWPLSIALIKPSGVVSSNRKVVLRGAAGSSKHKALILCSCSCVGCPFSLSRLSAFSAPLSFACHIFNSLEYSFRASLSALNRSKSKSFKCWVVILSHALLRSPDSAISNKKREITLINSLSRATLTKP